MSDLEFFGGRGCRRAEVELTATPQGLFGFGSQVADDPRVSELEQLDVVDIPSLEAGVTEAQAGRRRGQSEAGQQHFATVTAAAEFPQSAWLAVDAQAKLFIRAALSGPYDEAAFVGQFHRVVLRLDRSSIMPIAPSSWDHPAPHRGRAFAWSSIGRRGSAALRVALLAFAVSACRGGPDARVPRVSALRDAAGVVLLDPRHYPAESVVRVPRGARLLGSPKGASALELRLMARVYERALGGGSQRELWLWYRPEGVRGGFQEGDHGWPLETPEQRREFLAAAHGLEL